MKKLFLYVFLGLLWSDVSYAIIYTKSGNIDIGLALIWAALIIFIIWFVGKSTLDGFAHKRYEIAKQEEKDKLFEKYKSYYERKKRKKRRKK